MIIVNTLHIGDKGLEVKGREPAEMLELGAASGLKPQGSIAYKLSAVMAGQDMILTGMASLKVKTVCGRCLASVSRTLESGGICHHYPKVMGDKVDVTDDIREDMLLEIPQGFLCSDTCKGLCSSCGANLNKKSCACKPEEPFDDSAWDELDKLKLK